MKPLSRLLGMLLAAAAILATPSCSQAPSTTKAEATAKAEATTSSAVATSSTVATSTTANSEPTTASTVTTSSAPAGAQASGSVDGVDVTVSAADSAALRPGGDPMEFTVTLANTTSADIADVGLVVAMGHCSCTPSGAKMMPPGSMRMLDPDTKEWVKVPYVREGTGTDYLGQTIVPPFTLKQGVTNTYQFQVGLDPNPDVTAGDGTVSVTVRTPSGSGAAATIPVTVEP